MTQKIRQGLVIETLEDMKLAATAEIGGGRVAAGTNVQATEEAVRLVRRTRLRLTDFVITVTAANDYGGTKLCDLPDSNLLLVGVEANLSITKDGTGIIAAATPGVAIGTAVASNATLSGAMVDVIDETALAGTLTAAFSQHTNANSSPVIGFLDDSATLALWLNTAVSITADGTLTCSGTIDIYYLDTGNLGS